MSGILQKESIVAHRMLPSLSIGAHFRACRFGAFVKHMFRTKFDCSHLVPPVVRCRSYNALQRTQTAENDSNIDQSISPFVLATSARLPARRGHEGAISSWMGLEYV